MMILIVCILILIAITKYFNKVLSIDTEFFPIMWDWKFSIDRDIILITMCFFTLVITLDEYEEDEEE